MKNLKKILVAMTLMVAVFAFAGCGNNNANDETTVEQTTMEETTTENNTTQNTTTNRGNAGNMNNESTNDESQGLIDDIGDDIESGVDSIDNNNRNR